MPEPEARYPAVDMEEVFQSEGSSDRTPTVMSNLESRVQSLRGGGRPLSSSVQAFFEARFGHDFSQVRVHTDMQASELAQEMNSRAFAVGHDIVFGADQYKPGAAIGKRLLAHELTHVIQQLTIGHRMVQPSELECPGYEEGEVELSRKDRFYFNCLGRHGRYEGNDIFIWRISNFAVDEHELQDSKFNPIRQIVLTTFERSLNIFKKAECRSEEYGGEWCYAWMHLDITGWADCVGKAPYNEKLARLRAESVKAWLINNMSGRCIAPDLRIHIDQPEGLLPPQFHQTMEQRRENRGVWIEEWFWPAPAEYQDEIRERGEEEASEREKSGQAALEYILWSEDIFDWIDEAVFANDEYRETYKCLLLHLRDHPSDSYANGYFTEGDVQKISKMGLPNVPDYPTRAFKDMLEQRYRTGDICEDLAMNAYFWDIPSDPVEYDDFYLNVVMPDVAAAWENVENGIFETAHLYGIDPERQPSATVYLRDLIAEHQHRDFGTVYICSPDSVKFPEVWIKHIPEGD